MEAYINPSLGSQCAALAQKRKHSSTVAQAETLVKEPESCRQVLEQSKFIELLQISEYLIPPTPTPHNHNHDRQFYTYQAIYTPELNHTSFHSLGSRGQALILLALCLLHYIHTHGCIITLMDAYFPR